MMEQASTRRKRLATLLRATGDVIRVGDAAAALGMGQPQAARLLTAWHNQGVIRRVARGRYVPVSPTALGREQVLEEPWILVPELYTPGYVGGWSALEHWELTEQVFRSVCVLTGKRTTYGDVAHQGVGFFIKHVSPARIFGTKTIWRDRSKIAISDPHKTILDIIDDPALGAGLQHVEDCLKVFRKNHSSQEDDKILMQYAKKFSNGALMKKLGFWAERIGFDESFINECASNMTKGHAHLDKNMGNKKLVTRWKLWIPEGFENDRQG